MVAEGFSPGVLERWGLGYEEQKKIRPGVIYVKQSGMGAFGTYGRFRAVGPIAAALSGMSEMSGLPSPAPPAGWGYSYLDWFGAYSMALSVLAALYHRDRTGEGQWIDASQTEAGIMLTQVPVLDWSANGRAWERTGNRAAYQQIAPQGIYRCAGRGPVDRRHLRDRGRSGRRSPPRPGTASGWRTRGSPPPPAGWRTMTTSTPPCRRGRAGSSRTS